MHQGHVRGEVLEKGGREGGREERRDKGIELSPHNITVKITTRINNVGREGGREGRRVCTLSCKSP